jgi:putative ABC transport system substrate-binding protein
MNNGRRALGAAFACAMLAVPRLGRAQAKSYRLGILEIGDSSQPSGEMNAFVEQLTRLGVVEGVNLTVDRRYAQRDRTRLDSLAAELVALKPDVIFTASGTLGALAAQKATTTIPIVFDASNDPVAARLVASLPRPGGNLTGSALFGSQLDIKRLQILGEVVGDRSLIAVLGGLYLEESQKRQLAELAAAVGPSTRLRYFSADGPDSYAPAFEQMARERIDALTIIASPVVSASRRLIAGLAEKHRFPAIADGRAFAEAGLMLTYTTDFAELYRRAAEYVAKILKGASPDSLPVEHVSRFELVVNLKTARALRVRIPKSVLARADDLIE